MSAALQLHPLLSVEAYLAGEEGAECRHEYVAGRVFAMTGASVRHNRIAGNLFALLHARMAGTSCQVLIADVKLHCRLDRDDAFYYPDLMVCCDPSDDASHFRERPCLVVEVLSDTTRTTDSREKLFAYTRIDGLQGYLLLEQERAEATLYRRATGWAAECFADPAARLPLPCGEETAEVVLGGLYA